MSNSKLSKLTEDQWFALDNIYQRLPDISVSYSASGVHFQLASLLRSFGYNPMSRNEAIKLTERLLSNGY